jgi:2-polyprenyl-3-methyl-5-hydroxy-6-metoxy-1,4-benzoquinol methylase
MQVQEFWHEYYQQVFARGASHLDYSNETVHLQTLAAAIDGCGSIHGRRCLDVGAGRGLLSRTLQALGADQVCAVDFIADAVEELRNTTPLVDCKVAGAEDITIETFGATFDRIFVVEVLQYVDMGRTLQNLWSLLAPRGRLIGVVPNSDNEIVSQVIKRFENKFHAVSLADLMRNLSSLPGVTCYRLKGLSFGTDQSVAAYETTNWSPWLTSGERFNRIAFVALKPPE